MLALLIEAYGQMGQVAAGLTLVHEAMEIVHTTEQRYAEVRLHWLKGELLLASSDPQAEASLLQALHMARAQEARAWELRAALSLGRLWQQVTRRLRLMRLAVIPT